MKLEDKLETELHGQEQLEEQLELLSLHEIQLLLHSLLKKQQEIVTDSDGDEQEQLLDGELFEEDGDDQVHDLSLDELHLLLQMNELQLKLELCLLLEQQRLKSEDDGELQDELLDTELLDGELEETLLDDLLEEQLILLELSEMQLRLGLCRLEELQRLKKEEGGLLHEEQLD